MTTFSESGAGENSENEEQASEDSFGAPIKKQKEEVIFESNSDDEEEDDDAKIEEEMKDLINDDDEEDEDSSDSSSSSSLSSSGEESADEDKDGDRQPELKKRRHHHFDDDLEDEDYDLIEENLGCKIERKKKLKRIKAFDDDEEEEKENEKDVLTQELEGGEQSKLESAADRDDRQEKNLSSETGSEDDANGFIDDDGDQLVTKPKEKRQLKHTDCALQDAKDIFGSDFDLNDVQESGDEENFENDDEGNQVNAKAKTAKRNAPGKTSIFEIFEPSEFEREYFTDRDEDIRSTDAPERFQLRSVKVTPADKTEIAEEAEWIYKQCFQNSTISIQKPTASQESSSDRNGGRQPLGGQKNRSAVKKIAEALRLMRNSLFEVPFIAFYRKEFVQPDLTIDDLWIIYKWDERWCQLRLQKQNMERLFEKMQKYVCDLRLNDDCAAEHLRQIEENDFERLRDVQTSEELRDVYLHFLLYYARAVPAMQESNLQKDRIKRRRGENGKAMDDQQDQFLKRSRRKCYFDVFREMGLTSLAEKFGLTPQKFGENLRDNYQRHEVVQFPLRPLEASAQYVNDRLETPSYVLKAARYMVACEIANDPVVRRRVRETFFERAKLCVVPTKEGMKEIDESHPCYSFKYLKNKPVIFLRDDQFLKIVTAEEEKLLKISIRMDSEGCAESRTYASEIRQFYHRDEFSKNVQEWNAQREEALNYALTKLLYPTFEKELKLRLLREAYDHVLRSVSSTFHDWLKVAPYRPPDEIQLEKGFDTHQGVRIMAIAYENDWNVPAFGALISGDGEVEDYLRLENILKRRKTYRESERAAKISELAKLKKFLDDKKPHCVVISSESREALFIKEDIEHVINELRNEKSFPALQVLLLDCNAAIVYANSKRAEQDFQEYPPLLKRAISLARRMQDPLVEFSQLCGPDEEILCLKYHPLQDIVPKEEFQWALTLELINRTNEVGVDINRCVEQSHTSGLLQFVSGLGPRRAHAIINILKQHHSKLDSRTNLVTTVKFGPKVFFNCAGFIRIGSSSFPNNNNNTSPYAELLDASRIHPEMYEGARMMAIDALKNDDNENANSNSAGALEEILECPDKLNELDLVAFAAKLERLKYGNKSITVYDIRAELNHRYKDSRVEYTPPDRENLFYLLTKETPETFSVGKLVTCSVTGVTRKKPQRKKLYQAKPQKNDESDLWQCPFCKRDDFPGWSEVWNHFEAADCHGRAVGVRVRFENGVTGLIQTSNLSDNQVSNPKDRVKIGQIVHGRITKIDTSQFFVDLTTKSSDLADKSGKSF